MLFKKDDDIYNIGGKASVTFRQIISQKCKGISPNDIPLLKNHIQLPFRMTPTARPSMLNS
jgi:hypothetical protein